MSGQGISESELRQNLTELFKLYDKDENGMVSREEAKHFWRALGGNPTQSDVDALFESRSGGKEDLLCESFLDYLKENGSLDMAEQEAENLKKAFEVFDKDKNGFITRDELEMIMSKRGDEPLDKEQLESLLEAIDTSGDGVIHYNEFIKLMFQGDTDEGEEYDFESSQHQDDEDGY